MTARRELRIGNRRLGRGQAPIDATPAPPVGETLQAARERKGVDLYRAERDTKIRLRYLAALEDSAYEDLPAPVYTKGFLRNYAIYLGLDPDDLLERWRDEMEAQRAVERVAVAPPPQPIAAPGRRVTVTPALFVAGLVVLVILAFVGYVGFQLLRYAEVTPVGLTSPKNVFSTIDAESTVLEGTSGPGAAITIRGPGDELYNTNSHEDGKWSEEVALARGRNDFAITATDPVTQRESAQLLITINRPLPEQTAAPPSSSATAPPPVVLTMSLTNPVDGTVSTDGNIIVSGTTTGSRVTVESLYLGGPGATPGPSTLPTPAQPSPTPTPEPTPTATPNPSGGPTPQPTPSGSLAPIGPATDITVPPGGAFADTLTFPLGQWQLTITSFGIGVAPISETRTITVSPPITGGVELIINVHGRESWVRATADGHRVEGLGTLHNGDSRTITAVSELCMRTGNAGSLQLTLNGLEIGSLGTLGEVGTWVFRPGQAPEHLDTPC